MKIAILHPQCRIQGGAIKMALFSTRLLTEAGHDTILYTFSHSPECFSDLQKNIKIELHEPAKNVSFSPLKKLINIITLAWRLRHVDIIIANNPPMQIVAALAKIFSLKFKRQNSKGKIQKEQDYKKTVYNFSFFIFHFSLSSLTTIWWHHHTPWYMSQGDKKEEKCLNGMSSIKNNKEGIIKKSAFFLFSLFSFIGLKGFLERTFIMPYIDTMIVTSHFVGEQLKIYSGRDSRVIHPVLEKIPQQLNKNNTPTHDSQVFLFTHGRLEPGKGIETIVRIFEEIKKEESKKKIDGNIHLTIYGTGSLEKSLKAQGIDVQPYDSESTLTDIAKSGMASLAIYASTIDAFGMASLEAQSTGISTVILDRGGARETLVSDVSGEYVGQLVDSEQELYSTVSYFITNKKFPKNMSIVNFSHTIDYFTPQRLSSDLLSVINKTR